MDSSEHTDAADSSDATQVTYGEFRRWYRQMQLIGGCANPVHLVGHTITTNTATGEIVHLFSSHDMPYGKLMVACRNRRDSVCAPCSLLHKGDTYQIVVSGLAGGKGVGTQVAAHPRVFATLTAPSFGAVHRAGACHVRRDRPKCRHGNAQYCGRRHASDDKAVGTPLCRACYDYQTAILWNASSGKLWHRYCNQVRRLAASHGGVPRSELGSVLRVAFVKVVEYQRRGAVHLHAVIRFDGPEGSASAPPAWADSGLLARIAREAGPQVSATIPDPSGGVRTLRFGEQIDAKEIKSAVVDGEEQAVSERAAAAYIAKYVTKGDITGLVLARRIETAGQIDMNKRLTAHGKTLMRTAWELGAREEYADLKLRRWAHQLAFRGHVATKSLGYSTTYGALRADRAAFRREAAGLGTLDDPELETESHWRYAGSGLTSDQAEVAAGIAEWTAIRRGPRPDWIDLPPEPEP